jgi:hypothetical protein
VKSDLHTTIFSGGKVFSASPTSLVRKNKKTVSLTWKPSKRKRLLENEAKKIYSLDSVDRFPTLV